MLGSYAWAGPVLRSIVAMVLGFIAVTIVNLPAASIVERFFPGSLDADGMPLTVGAQGAFLPIIFLAGVAGAFMVVLFAPRAPVGHAVVFAALALLGDLAIVTGYREIWPLWFSALLVLSVPPQVWIGTVFGLRVRRRREVRRRTGAAAEAASLPLTAGVRAAGAPGPRKA